MNLQSMCRVWLLAALIALAQSAAALAHDDDCETPGGICGGDAHAPDLMPISADGTENLYVLQGGQWPQPGGMGTPITLTYSYQNMFDGGIKMPNGQPLPSAVIRQSIEDALRLWTKVAPINYVEVPDDGLEYYGGATQYGQIRFRHTYINGPDPQVGDPIAKAQAWFPANGPPIAGDVEFDHSDPWQVNGALHEPDIFGAATHEIGHTLGLGHTSVQGAVMYWVFHRFNGPGTGALWPVDLNGVQAIYGIGEGSVTPLSHAPEPGTFLMAAIPILWSFLRVRHRRRR